MQADHQQELFRDMAVYRAGMGNGVEVFDHYGWLEFLKLYSPPDAYAAPLQDMTSTDEDTDSEIENDVLEDEEVTTAFMKLFLNDEEVEEMMELEREWSNIARALKAMM